jgi:hypothetical protein
LSINSQFWQAEAARLTQQLHNWHENNRYDHSSSKQSTIY